MRERFSVVDCDNGRAWKFDEEATAVRYAAALHAAHGSLVEVVRNVQTDDGTWRGEQITQLPPAAL